jgi:hypothetical protein
MIMTITTDDIMRHNRARMEEIKQIATTDTKAKRDCYHYNYNDRHRHDESTAMSSAQGPNMT